MHTHQLVARNLTAIQLACLILMVPGLAWSQEAAQSPPDDAPAEAFSSGVPKPCG